MDENKYRDDYYDDNYIDDEFENSDELTDDDYFETDSEEYAENLTDYYSFYEEAERDLPRRPERKKKNKKSFSHFLFKLSAFLIALFVFVSALSFVFSLFTPKVTNILIMATDQDGTRTDTLMIASFNKKTDKLTFLSVPRDTYITVSDETYSLMNEEYPQPGSKSMKINTVHHYGGEKYGVDLVKNEVENLLGIDINYHVKLDFEAFRYIIDSFGGIEFDVPCNMVYNDPTQNLYINISQGLQVLNGEQAEHLLRFRSGYANADIGRISVQQDFMKAFMTQTLSKKAILFNLGTYFNVLFRYVETDIGIFDTLSYLTHVTSIDTQNIDSHTLPGTGAMRGGQSVYIPHVSEIANLVSEICSD